MIGCGILLPVQAEIDDPTKPLFVKQKKNPETVSRKVSGKATVVKKSTEPAERFHLGSTLISDNRRVAVVNGKVVSVGDRVGSAKVVTIDSTQVVLKKGNRNIRLALDVQKIHRVNVQRTRKDLPKTGLRSQQ